MPYSKRCAFLLLGQALHRMHSHPMEENWERFGFCTCKDEREEKRLANIYLKLLLGEKLADGRRSSSNGPTMQTATFTEFWQAHEARTLIPLMDSKGYKKDRLSFPYLAGFLSDPAEQPPLSVWYLKQFVTINDPQNEFFKPAIWEDYGFVNCQGLEDICFLMELYRRLLEKAGPLELHRACLGGTLFEFAQRYQRVDTEKLSKLLRG